MSKMRYKFSQLSKVGLLTVMLAAGTAMIVSTQANATEAEAPTERLVVATATTTQGLNILAAPRPGGAVIRVRQMGSGSWICSPAGFGQRSRCYRN